MPPIPFWDAKWSVLALHLCPSARLAGLILQNPLCRNIRLLALLLLHLCWPNKSCEILISDSNEPKVYKYLHEQFVTDFMQFL